MSKNSSSKTVLVTGASGALGGPLVRALEARGYQVRALGREDADIADREALRAAIGQGPYATVIHLAACTKSHSKEVYERVNVTGTANLLALLAEHGTERFIYMSSRASRADCGAYGASKDRAAALVRASPIPSIILEPGEVYGGSSADALSSVVRLATRFGIVLRVAPATLAPVHIDDVIAATVATLSVPATGQTYVLTGPETLTLTEIGERATSGRFALHVYVPTWALRVLARIAQIAGSTSIVEDQVDRYLCEKPSDSSSARRDLGFSPRPFKP